MNNNLIERWEKIVLIISLIVLLLCGFLEVFNNCVVSSYPTLLSIITGLFSGFVATIVVLFLQRRHEQNELKSYFLKYQGCYVRTDIGQDNTGEEELSMMRAQNVGLFISITYLGGHEFSLMINYWKDHNAKAKGFIEFNPKDKQTGLGNYRYIEGIPFVGEDPHYGQLEVSWDDVKSEMILFYRHKYPREISFNPDNNRGWEVWKKTDENNCS